METSSALQSRSALGVDMTISVLFARGLMSEVHRRGVDPRVLLRDCGIDSLRLDDASHRLSLDEADRLARSAMRLTGDPGLGLAMGAHAPYCMLQVFGYLVLAQGTLRAAYGVLSQYAGLVADGFQWKLSEAQDVAEFSCVPDVELGDATRFAMEYAMVTAKRIGQHFLSTRAVPTEARFRHARPRHFRRYASALSCPVRFDQHSTALIFPRDYLDRAQPHADSMMSTMLRQTADRMLQEKTPALRVRHRLESILRYEADPASAQLDDMAQRLGITARTLRDNLRREGLTLTSLIEETRCRIACDELCRPRTTIKATAERLGFSQPSAFHRAFRRWTGRTPVEFLQLQAAPPSQYESADASTWFRRRA